VEIPFDVLTDEFLAEVIDSGAEGVATWLSIAGAFGMRLAPLDPRFVAMLSGAEEALDAWWRSIDLDLERIADVDGDGVEASLSLVPRRHEVDLWIAGLCALGRTERAVELSLRVAPLDEKLAAALLRGNHYKAVRHLRREFAKHGYPTGAVPTWVTRMIDTSAREIAAAVDAGLFDEAAVSAATRDAVVNDPVARDVFLEQCEVADKASGGA